jgi:4-diphosphocytidyl-2-C-methyl-D-erythritol kinase
VSAPTTTLPAFAKINLSLRVLGKRPDGYHQIDTVLQTISLHDTLEFQVTDESEISLSCDNAEVPADEQNLVWRAANALKQKYSEKRGARIRLIKRIPAQAGLGGGSSDAASTLIALAHLWELDDVNDLPEIASALGADVPFFLHGGTARGTGLGDSITGMDDLSETFVLVIKPNASVSTADAYAALNARALTTSDAKIILSSSQADDISDKLNPKTLQNDFEAVVLKLAPEIERAKSALLKTRAQAALLAGSGSAVFGFFENKDAQERAIQAIELETGWRVFPCKTVGRRHFETAMGPAGEVLTRVTGKNAGA